jgi:hypothetical protein
MDDQQAAEAQDQVIPGVSAGALLQAMENPEIFAEIARGDLYVQMARMREQARNPEMPVTQRMEYMKTLAKMGKVDNPSQADNPLASLPVISIVFPGQGTSVQIGMPRPQEKIVNQTESRDLSGEVVSDKKPRTAVIPK